MTVNRYCTPEWLASSQEAYRNDPRFQKELAKLSTTMCFRVKAEPTWGIEQDIIFGGSVDQGKLEKLAFFSEDEARQEAEFVVAATPQKWKQILRKEAKFVTEFILGRVVLEQGSKVGVIGVAPYSGTFIDALTQVELQFQDEMSPEELADYRAYVEEFRAESGV